ncbi:MAG: hypothetical protein ACI9CF_000591 [Candidatus Omnitrophota bacterium]|jgi:hypothetical protein
MLTDSMRSFQQNSFIYLFGICFLILCLVGYVYYPVLDFEFLSLDDGQYILNNPHLREGISLSGIFWAFKADLLIASDYSDYWQPVTLISHMLDIQLFGYKAGAHHWTNVIIHTLNVLLLFFLFKSITRAYGLSLLVALIFAMHPIQVESVAWITSRKHILALFWGLLIMHYYVKHLDKRTFVQQGVLATLFGLALMTKATMLILPIIMVLLDYWPLRRMPTLSIQNIFKNLFYEKWPLLVIAILYIPIPFVGNAHAMDQGLNLGLIRFPAMISRVFTDYLFYVCNAFYPMNLSLYGPVAQIHIEPYRVIVSMIGMGTILFGVWKWRLKASYLIIGFMWFVVALTPMLVIERPADRFMYFPLCGLAVMLVWGMRDVLSSLPWKKSISCVLGIGLIGTLSLLSTYQIEHWRNNESLYRHTIKHRPNVFVAYLNLGNALKRRGQSAEAEKFYLQALQVYPNYPEALINLSLLYLQTDRRQKAHHFYDQAIRLGQLRPALKKHMDFLRSALAHE